MLEPQSLFPGNKLSGRGRKSVQLASSKLVTIAPLFADKAIPLVVRAVIDGVDLLAWAKSNRDDIEKLLLQHGAILFRGFNVSSTEALQSFAEATSSGGLIDYTYGSTPRHRLTGTVYTSTEYPAELSIPFHNEMSYSRNWPMKIWFCCLKPSDQGGATPIADSAKVFNRIDARTRAKFEERGVMYVRNYRDNLDLSCRAVFGTDDRQQIEEFCLRAGIQFAITEDGTLRTRQICQGVARHPQKGHPLWFNQAHLFHISNLDENTSRTLLAEYGVDGIPRNACFGDGSPIELSDLEEIREAYRQEGVTFSWELGDVLMLDNMAVAHAREPFVGERKIVVAMAESNSGLPPEDPGSKIVS